jgi:hypothetical protein
MRAKRSSSSHYESGGGNFGERDCGYGRKAMKLLPVLRFTTAQYAAVLSTVALLVSFGSLYVSKLSYDLSSAKDQREVQEKLPAVDVQVHPDDASTAAVKISILNRSDINIAPLDVTVVHSFEIGDLYLSSAQQSVNLLKSSLSLSRMGTIAPKGVGTLEARVSGVTDGKTNSFVPGLELQFAVRIRFADDQDTIKTFSVIRRILPALAAEPCPPTWTLATRPPGC